VSSLSTCLTHILTGPTCPRKHVRRVACQLFLTGFCPMGPDCPRGQYVVSFICARHPTPSHGTNSPKPNIPPPSAYDPLPPPSPRDLGPPPPGYGRYADFDHGPGSGIQSGGGQPPRRNLDEVMCFKVKRPFARPLHLSLLTPNEFKCGEKGHYANHCTNRNKPGNRGGIDRTTRRFDD